MVVRMEKKITVLLAILPLLGIFGFGVSPHLAHASNRSSLLVYVDEDYFKSSRNGTMWTKVRSKRFEESSEVQMYLGKLNNGEFNDWRLPTKQELFDLFSVFDLKNNGEVKVRIEGKYWLSDSEGQMSVGTWEIGEGCGPERRYFSGGKGYVRAVRP